MPRAAFFYCVFLVFFTLIGCHPQEPIAPSLSANKVAARAKAQRVFSFLHKGYTDKAYAELQAALYLAPDDTVILDTAGYYYEKTGQLPIANRFYKQAVKDAPLSGIAKNNYAAFLCRNGWYKESLPYFQEAMHATHTTIRGEAYKNWQYCKLKMQTTLGGRAT